jgi:hypothetical protein
VEAALDAVRRGILVEIYADLGFNDEVSRGLARGSPCILEVIGLARR